MLHFSFLTKLGEESLEYSKLLCILHVVVMIIQAAPITMTVASIILPIIMPLIPETICFTVFHYTVQMHSIMVSWFMHYEVLLNSPDINKYNFVEQYISITFLF